MYALDFACFCRIVRGRLGHRPEEFPRVHAVLASVATLVLMALSFFLLASALKHLPIGTAYAVWTGIGAVGTALLGIVLFGESASPARLLCIGLILAGIAGLKLLSDA